MLYFIIAGCLYILSASLPFLVTTKTQLYIGMIIGTLTSICWTLISRSVAHNDIPRYSLYYDIMLTYCYALTPYLFIQQELTMKFVLGSILIAVGIIILKS